MRLGNPSVRTLLLALSISSLPLLSACVGSTVSSSLETAALEAPNDLTPAEEAFVSDFTTLAALPVATRSPRSSELALASADTEPAIAAVNSITTNDPAVTEDTQLASRQIVEPGDASAEGEATKTAALAPSTTRPAKTANSAAPSPAANVGSGGVDQTADNSQSKPVQKEKKTGFWNALFGGKSKTTKKPTLAQKTQIARNTSSANPRKSVSANGSALPGVKRSSALFGIGSDDKQKPLTEIQDNVQVASVGSYGRYRTVNGLILQTEKVKVECFKPELMRILKIVERRYGKKVMVTSGYRSPKRNRRAGGVQNSTHIYCKAADIQVSGVSKWDLAKFLRTVDGRGGVGTYCRTKSVHIDTGSVRDWHHPCRRSKSRAKKRKT